MILSIALRGTAGLGWRVSTEERHERGEERSCDSFPEDSDATLRGMNFALWVVGNHWYFLSACNHNCVLESCL